MGGRIKIYYCSEKIENKRVRTNESSENKKKKKKTVNLRIRIISWEITNIRVVKNKDERKY